ncbi:hypothetical protein [Labilibaculum manganireducens]|uniref:Uncharacterized protein n=1 Tax=Labilibaculum manganireducens TaxID=1940525 RepID=A0A2N3IB77_9BACT|nr:hypothetical protein [Labilibaculum manganireducens]PKQ67528.1 hypothetical protein BZG01_07265 [Labilibaculum manganireducens]
MAILSSLWSGGVLSIIIVSFADCEGVFFIVKVLSLWSGGIIGIKKVVFTGANAFFPIQKLFRSNAKGVSK